MGKDKEMKRSFALLPTMHKTYIFVAAWWLKFNFFLINSKFKWLWSQQSSSSSSTTFYILCCCWVTYVIRMNGVCCSPSQQRKWVRNPPLPQLQPVWSYFPNFIFWWFFLHLTFLRAKCNFLSRLLSRFTSQNHFLCW